MISPQVQVMFWTNVRWNTCSFKYLICIRNHLWFTCVLNSKYPWDWGQVWIDRKTVVICQNFLKLSLFSLFLNYDIMQALGRINTDSLPSISLLVLSASADRRSTWKRNSLTDFVWMSFSCWINWCWPWTDPITLIFFFFFKSKSGIRWTKQQVAWWRMPS